MLGPWAPNTCIVVRRETMHHDHHTRARDRLGSARALWCRHLYFWTIKLSCFRTVFFYGKIILRTGIFSATEKFRNGKIINPPRNFSRSDIFSQNLILVLYILFYLRREKHRILYSLLLSRH